MFVFGIKDRKNLVLMIPDKYSVMYYLCHSKNLFQVSLLSFHRMPAGHPLQLYYSRIYKTYDRVNRLFTFGLDTRWRRHTVECCLRQHPLRMLDLCCGTGDLAISIGQAAKGKVFITGFDLNPEMLGIARQKAQGLSSEKVEFLRGDAASMPFRNEEFDCITMGFGFRNLTFENPARDQNIKEISRVLKPGARLIILESARPENPLVAVLYRLYLKFFLVPLGGVLSGDWKAYRYLARSSAGYYSFGDLRSMLKAYQLDLKIEKKFLLGTVNLYMATKLGS